ncbi:MAG: ROK family protein [Planctomycetota bacterium]
MTDVVAVDLGGTNIRAARVNDVGKILFRDKMPTQAEAGMAAVVTNIAQLVQKVRGPATVAVGVGTPGVPDQDTGQFRLPACNIPGSVGYPFTTELARQICLPVVADNDGNLAALGETWLGAGKDKHIVLIFTLGTGIGGGCVINGNVYHGHHNLGTEFGHVSIAYNGRKCACGGIGCLEAYASASALGRDAREALRTDPAGQLSALWKMCSGASGLEKVDARLVCDAARNGDAFASALLDRCCNWLACGMGSLINVFNPSCVILGGGMALAGELITSRVINHLENSFHVYKPIWKDCKLCLAVLGDDAGILGAARMAWQKIES